MSTFMTSEEVQSLANVLDALPAPEDLILSVEVLNCNAELLGYIRSVQNVYRFWPVGTGVEE